MAEDLLDHAAALLADARATPEQLRFMLLRMREALTEVHRVAERPGHAVALKASRHSTSSGKASLKSAS